MWNSFQCAVQGRSHIKADIPCQDKTYSAVANDVQVIALADGAGSAKLSHHGAETVTTFLCSVLIEKFDTYFLDNDGVAVKYQIIEGLLKSLNERAEQLDCRINDLASTLLLVAIKKDRFIIAHIGDGVIGYLKNNELKIASQPENGEFINTTVFTTSRDAINTMKLIKGSLGEIQGFVLMSDGTETSLYNKKEHKFADVLKKIMQISTIVSLDKLQEQLEQSFKNVISQATTDDCSIAMLVKKNETFNGYMNLSRTKKCEILGKNVNTSKRVIRQYDSIFMFLLTKHTLSEVALKIHLKIKYARKHLDRLCMLNYIEKDNNFYKTILIMDDEQRKNH